MIMGIISVSSALYSSMSTKFSDIKTFQCKNKHRKEKNMFILWSVGLEMNGRGSYLDRMARQNVASYFTCDS